MTHYRVEHPDGYVLTKQAAEDDAKTQAKAVFDNTGERPTLVELDENGEDTKNKFEYPFEAKEEKPKKNDSASKSEKAESSSKK